MPNFDHFLRMTDDVGILQFSVGDIPNPQSGYTLDDNARALLVALSMGEGGYVYARRFLNFLDQAQRPDGSWSNFLLNGQYSSNFNSEDSIGRAIMACSAATRCEWPDIKSLAANILVKQLPGITSFTSPRAVAYCLVGLCKGKIPCTDKLLQEMVNQLAAYLTGLYDNTKGPDWMWFENYITYCNAILPAALFCVYIFNGNKKCLKVAHDSLNFLNDIVFSQNYLSIVGNQGWYHRGSKLPIFDQQPVDAASMAFACWEAYQSLGSSEYIYLAELAHGWYRGKNINGLYLYNESTGGCYDALTRDGVNLNQGAEAVLSLLLTDLLMSNNVIHEIKEAQ